MKKEQKLALDSMKQFAYGKYGIMSAEEAKIILSLIEEQQKEINCLKNHVHYKICESCKKEFISKRSDAIYCKECANTVNNKNWYRNLTEEKKERRRKQARISMRNIREKRRKYNECKKQSEKM